MVNWVIILEHEFSLLLKDFKIDYFKDVMIICVTISNHFTRGEILVRRNQNRRLGKSQSRRTYTISSFLKNDNDLK